MARCASSRARYQALVEQGLAGEERAEGGVVGAAAFPGAVAHEVEQRAQRGHGLLDGAVGEVVGGGFAHRADDVFDAFGEDGDVLFLGLEQIFLEDGARVAEHAAAEGLDEARGDAPAEPAREDALAVASRSVQRSR